jgi:hypothetical protein
MNTKSEELVELLRKKYPSPAYAVLEQVRSCTGYAKEIRTCDAMVMSLWASRGVHLSGFEIKVSRGDWMNEVKDPRKAEGFQEQCHFWYLLTSDETIAQMDEIPQTWGWIAKKNGTLKLLKEAPVNPTAKIDHFLLASVFRNVTEDHMTLAQHKALLKKEIEQAEKYAEMRHKDLIKDVKAFEEISGIKILKENAFGKYTHTSLDWEYKNIAKAVNMVLASEHIDIKNSLEGFRDTAKRICEKAEAALEGLPKK